MPYTDNNTPLLCLCNDDVIRFAKPMISRGGVVVKLLLRSPRVRRRIKQDGDLFFSAIPRLVPLIAPRAEYFVFAITSPMVGYCYIFLANINPMHCTCFLVCFRKSKHTQNSEVLQGI